MTKFKVTVNEIGMGGLITTETARTKTEAMKNAMSFYRLFNDLPANTVLEATARVVRGTDNA